MNKIKKIYYYLRQALYIDSIDKRPLYAQNRAKANIVRLTHAIEKGLCIRKPRLGYGKDKISFIIRNIDFLNSSDANFHNSTIFFMAYDALTEYIHWHDKQKYNNDTIEKIREWLRENKNPQHPREKFGGTIEYIKKPVDLNSIINLFNNRHSVRDYLDVEINKNDLTKAINLANRYPSACNRQAVRLYIINHKHKECLEHWFTGNPGFWDDAKEFIMVCAKISAYVPDEYQQYEVSAGIYTGFLVLALQAYGIGSCIIQREVLSTSDWRKFSASLGIPGDEQLICIISCGYQNEKSKVPLSHRFSIDEMTKFID